MLVVAILVVVANASIMWLGIEFTISVDFTVAMTTAAYCHPAS